MPVDQVFTPKVVEENPFPQEGVSDATSTQSTSGQVFRPEQTREQGFPTKRTAVELLSVALNTKSKKVLQEFELVQSGGFQIGKYENGVSGDVRITPNGITARNAAGNDTFALDATTGDATFSGTVQAGTFISGLVIVGNNSWVIDGDSENPSILMYNNNIPSIFIGNI